MCLKTIYIIFIIKLMGVGTIPFSQEKPAKSTKPVSEVEKIELVHTVAQNSE